MASFGVDRYGRPVGSDQQANPYKQQQQNNPAAQHPDQNQQQQSGGQFAQQDVLKQAPPPPPQNSAPPQQPAPQANTQQQPQQGASKNIFSGSMPAVSQLANSIASQGQPSFGGQNPTTGDFAKNSGWGQLPNQQPAQANGGIWQGPQGQQPQAPRNIPGSSPEDIAVAQKATAGNAPGAQLPAATPQQIQQHYNTKLMEGDPSKLADPNHAAHSPKYDFLQAVQGGNFNYDQLPQVLSQLQSGPNAQMWQGWSADKDKLNFTGNPNQLAPEWNGVKTVDAVGAYGNMAQGQDPAGFRWGVDAPGGPQQQGQMNGPQMMSQMLASSQGPSASAAPGGAPAATQAPSQDPFGGQGVQLPGGQWVPKDHPLAQQAKQAQAAGAQGAPLSGQYEGDWAQGFRPPDAAIYKPGQLPTDQLPTYQGQNISQFNGPNQSAVESPLQGLIQSMMGSTSMSDQGVNQLKERQKESALSMQKQLQDQFGQQAAARGVSGGGQMDAMNRRLGDSTLSTILGGNRDIDIAKMQQDRTDQLNAASAGNDYLNGQMNRATAGYGAQLSGQQAQAGEAYKAYGSQADKTKFNLDRASQQEGLNQQGAQSSFSNWLNSNQLGQGQQGLNIDSTRVANQNNQFNMSNDLANKQMQDDMKKWRAMLNYQYQNSANTTNQGFWQ